MSVYSIDCQYIEAEIAAAFLVVEGKEASFVENNTVYAVPELLHKLDVLHIKTEDVKYIIITHVHLDHAGGTAELLSHCPNAIVLAHPKAAPHVIDPKRLIESSKKVYGEEKFNKLYGEIKPVPQDKVRIMQDGEELGWGTRTLKFIYTRGHANHHFVVHDSKTNGIFTGDSFGIGYKHLQKGNLPFIFPSTTPTDFDYEEAKLSVQKIVSLGARKVYLTHFGEWSDITLAAEQMMFGLERMEEIRKNAVNSDLKDEDLDNFCSTNIGEYFREEIFKRGMGESELRFLDFDRDINAMGLAHSARRERAKLKSPIQ